jgi:hypothetical protein
VTKILRRTAVDVKGSLRTIIDMLDEATAHS